MAERFSFEGNRDLRWFSVGGTLITYLREDVAFDDALWDRWLARLEDPVIARLILACWGAVQPTHQQWRRANKIMRARDLAIACVTESRHSLALVKAASWVGTRIQGFAWNQLSDACDFAGVPADQRIEIKTKLPALRDVFGRMVSDVTVGQQAPRTSILGLASGIGYSSEEIQKNLDELQAQLRALRKNKAGTEPEAPEDVADPRGRT